MKNIHYVLFLTYCYTTFPSEVTNISITYTYVFVYIYTHIYTYLVVFKSCDG